MSRYHVRCANRACQARRVLRRHPEDYLRIPPCRSCGGLKYWISHWMNKRNTRAMGCTCNGYVPVTGTVGWMHRKGSPYCWFRKDGTQRMPGDTDFKDALLERETS